LTLQVFRLYWAGSVTKRTVSSETIYENGTAATKDNLQTLYTSPLADDLYYVVFDVDSALSE